MINFDAIADFTKLLQGLNEYFEKLLDCRNITILGHDVFEVNCTHDGVILHYSEQNEGSFPGDIIECETTISYNDLFSMDSTLLDQVERKRGGNVIRLDGIYRPDEYEDNWEFDSIGTDNRYFYMLMGPMTTRSKIEYFLANVFITPCTDDVD